MELRRITDIVVRHSFRQDLGDLEGLADSIATFGLLVPVTVTPENVLVFGLRRLRACEWLGWDTIPVTVLEVRPGGPGIHPESGGG
jgi:ParB family chromosome partitioning protein